MRVGRRLEIKINDIYYFLTLSVISGVCLFFIITIGNLILKFWFRDKSRTKT